MMVMMMVMMMMVIMSDDHKRDSDHWYCWPAKGGLNPGQPPHHRVCDVCRASLRTDNLDKELHRASRCGVDYECPDGACGPNGC
jgi:hypothetical protein